MRNYICGTAIEGHPHAWKQKDRKKHHDRSRCSGSPNGSDYEDEPESGKTGYYYYDTFTVSTTFDDDGNEVVSGVW